MKKSIVFASNNLNKVKEIQEMLTDFRILSLKDLDSNIEIEETAMDLKGNALIKANYVLRNFNIPCFADDTGLEVDALDGRPGVYSARYAGLHASDQDNVDKLLSEMENKSDRKARFKTIIAFVDGRREHLFEGRCEGDILKEAVGKNGFGYDPVFRPENKNISFAEMSSSEKAKISHRGKAVQSFVEFLKGYEQK